MEERPVTGDTPIYMDNNATTPLDPRVLEAMLPWLRGGFGNPGSTSHGFGRAAADAVEAARFQVAELVGAEPQEVVFTSGATESNNLAIKGVAEAQADRGRHIVTCLTEHKSVIEPCRHLAARGFEVTWLAPDRYGRVSPGQVADALRDETILVTLMAANNETGTLHPVDEIAPLVRRRGALFHSDATQAVGKMPVDVAALQVDLLSLSAHKLYGPMGVAALVVRRRRPRVRLACQLHGGGQEGDLRSGTLNVPGIVGLGAAARVAHETVTAEARELVLLRDRLHDTLSRALGGVTLNGHPTERLPNTLNVSFEFATAARIMDRADGLAVSSGSACTSAALEVSHVLKAMGLTEDAAHGAIRFSLGRFNTERDVDTAAAEIIEAVTALRRDDPLSGALAAARACDCKPGGCGGAERLRRAPATRT
jgi:cysteine desulfurase